MFKIKHFIYGLFLTILIAPGAYAQKVNEEPGPNLRQDLEDRNVDWITKKNSITSALVDQ